MALGLSVNIAGDTYEGTVIIINEPLERESLSV